jgi:hypothetical protein
MPGRIQKGKFAMSMPILERNNPLMPLITGRNQLIDAVFYDVTSLTAREWLSLKPLEDRKGGIVVVSPLKTNEPIRHYEHPLEFIVKERDRVEAIAVAGVGSSVVGTAALARTVADTYNISVAGIVSGYGLSDVVLEGLGGWFFYGRIDQLRYEMEKGLADLNAFLSQTFARGDHAKAFLKNFEFPLDDYVPPSLDVSCLNEILLVRYLNATRPKMKIRLLVGHSKGSLLISSALNHMNNELISIIGNEKYHSEDLSMKNLVVVTLGAVVDLPTELIKRENQYQFLGSLDCLGRLNSRSLFGDIAEGVTWIDGAGHYLNTKIPGHLDVKAVLQQYLPTSKLPHIPSEIQLREKNRDTLYRAAAEDIVNPPVAVA